MAVDKRTLLTVLADNIERVKKIRFQHRNIDLSEQMPYILVGVRRAGKSYLLYQKMHQMITEGHQWQDFIYVNFEDERLLEFDAFDFNALIECHYMLTNSEPVFFLDEIQNIQGWEKFARRLADEKKQVYLTGSNAKMLSDEMATTLGGRYLIRDVFPYNFNEFLYAHQLDTDNLNIYATKERGMLFQMFDQYYKMGGFPELVTLNNKRDYLNSIFQKIYLSDLMIRNGVTNKQVIELLLKKIAESVMQRISYSRLTNIIKTTGAKLGKSTTIQYIDYAISAKLIFKLTNHHGNLTEKTNEPKYYFIDNGLLNLFLIEGETALLENLIAIHLYKKYGDRLYFYQKNIEVDFYIPSEQMAVQVCYDLSAPDTYEREVESLRKLDEFLPCEKMTIVTLNDERTITVNNKTVNIIPAWRYILDEK